MLVVEIIVCVFAVLGLYFLLLRFLSGVLLRGRLTAAAVVLPDQSADELLCTIVAARRITDSGAFRPGVVLLAGEEPSEDVRRLAARLGCRIYREEWCQDADAVGRDGLRNGGDGGLPQ